MRSRERLGVLRATGELAALGEDALRALLPFFDEVSVRAGDCLAQEGRLCHQFLVVAEGRLQTRERGRTGVLEQGDTFGWMAMRDRGVNAASVTALSDARVLVMSHEQFRALDALTARPESPPRKFAFRFWALPPPAGPSPTGNTWAERRRERIPRQLRPLRDRAAAPPDSAHVAMIGDIDVDHPDQSEERNQRGQLPQAQEQVRRGVVVGANGSRPDEHRHHLASPDFRVEDGADLDLTARIDGDRGQQRSDVELD